MPRRPRSGDAAGYAGAPVRVLIIPGLRDSGEAHWQTWLQRQYHRPVRVQQADWQRPDLNAWSARIDAAVARAAPGTRFIAVAHSFGCLALADHLARRRAGREPAPDSRTARGGGAGTRAGVVAALLVAPASPDRFDLAARLPHDGLGVAAVLAGSETDPWMTLDEARLWARRWAARFVNLGAAGHVNVELGHGPWPQARIWVDALIRYEQRRLRIERAHPLEFSYAL